MISAKDELSHVVETLSEDDAINVLALLRAIPEMLEAIGNAKMPAGGTHAERNAKAALGLISERTMKPATKQTAGNNVFLRNVKKLFNAKSLFQKP